MILKNFLQNWKFSLEKHMTKRFSKESRSCNKRFLPFWRNSNFWIEDDEICGHNKIIKLMKNDVHKIHPATRPQSRRNILVFIDIQFLDFDFLILLFTLYKCDQHGRVSNFFHSFHIIPRFHIISFYEFILYTNHINKMWADWNSE